VIGYQFRDIGLIIDDEDFFLLHGRKVWGRVTSVRVDLRAVT
jgi:hypothetical protein